MPIVIAAALAGLLATPHCAAMCGGFATVCARPRRGLAGWHAGRLVTYMTLGAVAGTFGRVLPGPAWLPAVLSATLLVWFAASLAGITGSATFRLPPLTRTSDTGNRPRRVSITRAGIALAQRPRTPHRVLFGAVTGLLPCGMVYAALSLAIAAGSPLSGAGVMLAFGAATVPGLTVLSVGVQRFAARGLLQRRILAAAILALGLWSVFARASADAASGHSHGADTVAATCAC